MDILYTVGITTAILVLVCPLLSIAIHLIPPLAVMVRGLTHFLIPIGGLWVCAKASAAFNLREPYGIALGGFLASYVFMRIAANGQRSGNNGIFQSYNMMALSLHIMGAAILLRACFG